jgi:hypothetical protein
VTSKPDVGVGIHIRDVVVQVLSHQLGHWGLRGTHRADRGVHAVLDQRFLNTCLSTLVASSIAVAHGRPAKVDSSTAAGEQEVVVELVILGSRSADTQYTGRGTFDGDDHRRVGFVSKLNVSEISAAASGSRHGLAGRPHQVPTRTALSSESGIVSQ